jgi:hypothetical protein
MDISNRYTSETVCTYYFEDDIVHHYSMFNPPAFIYEIECGLHGCDGDIVRNVPCILITRHKAEEGRNIDTAPSVHNENANREVFVGKMPVSTNASFRDCNC